MRSPPSRSASSGSLTITLEVSERLCDNLKGFWKSRRFWGFESSKGSEGPEKAAEDVGGSGRGEVGGRGGRAERKEGR